MSELWWSLKKIGMRIAMLIGGTFGFMLYQVSEAFKNIYDIVMYYIGNSVIIDAIIDGFKGLWNKLFNSEDGWLRWLTPDYWIGKFEALSTWWNGGQVVLDAFASAVDFAKEIWGGIGDWWDGMFGEEGTARMAFKGFIDWFQDKWDNLVGILMSPADVLKRKELTEAEQEVANQYAQGNLSKEKLWYNRKDLLVMSVKRFMEAQEQVISVLIIQRVVQSKKLVVGLVGLVVILKVCKQEVELWGTAHIL